MNENQHPLTETAAAGLWDARLDGSFWRELNPDQRENALTDMRSGWDAAMQERTPADPNHDPSPWQDCTRDDIREGDLVEAPYRDHVQVGVAHHQAESGDWMTKYGCPLTNGDHWPLRRIPAHAPEKETTMTENQHHLTETAAAKMWDEHVPPQLNFQGWDEGDQRRILDALHAVFDAGGKHERATNPAEPLARTLLAVPEGHGAPHHNVGRIKAGDYVMQMDKAGTIRGGRAHRQDRDGDWRNDCGFPITLTAARADRPDALTVWPAPTPPAEEVELPAGRPAHRLDVEDEDGNVFAYMALDRSGYWVGVDQDGELRVRGAHRLTAFTLPDGIRVYRDGDRPDGAPRFVKVQVGEK